jgi:sec-independent protein translocase protein TatA
MLGGIGWPEIVVILIIALIVFGPKRLPEMGRSLGRGIREFRGSLSGDHDEGDEDDEERRREIPAGDPGPAVADEKAEPVAHKRR